MDSESDIRAFFNPTSQLLHSPFLMNGMEHAVDVLNHVIAHGQKVMVFGDYDVDGTTATAMMSDFLLAMETPHEIYIPDRHREGYGLSVQAVESAIQMECKLLITLDCGIRALEPVQLARAAGMKVIICDHHEPGPEAPKANAILNPKKTNCGYPFKGLSGAGVTFKLIQAFFENQGHGWESMEDYLDLLAISTAADIVPVVDENRVLLISGLSQLNKPQRREGIQELLVQAKKEEGVLSMTDLVFVIAPRINAAGRLKSGELAVNLLRTHRDSKSKRELAEILEKLNQTRRGLDTQIKVEALEQLEINQHFGLTHSTVVYGDQW
ncbi:MAG: DHH family phosphoesterase, partial [Bacteroidota bacterium]